MRALVRSQIFWLLFFPHVSPASPAEKAFDVLGFSPELNVLFAQAYVIPEDGRCAGFILDLDTKIKFSMGPVVSVGPALVLAGEDAEGSSCQLRDFAGQLGIKLHEPKKYSEAEKKQFAALADADWRGPLPGYKSATVNSLGAFLRLHRPAFKPDLGKKLYELGATEAGDKNWVDAYSAVLIANDLKPGYADQDGRARAREIGETNEKALGAADKGLDAKKRAALWLAAEVAARLDSKNARPILDLARFAELGFARRARLVSRALALDPVMTTKSYREWPAFTDLRCDKKANSARKILPVEMTQDPQC